jgi:hypothetical protein
MDQQVVWCQSKTLLLDSQVLPSISVLPGLQGFRVSEPPEQGHWQTQDTVGKARNG